MDPYEVLGVTSLATPAEVTAAYRVRAQIFHPDRYSGSPQAVRDAAARRMALLNDSYKAIKNGTVPRGSADSGSTTARRPGTWAGAAAGTWASGASRRDGADARSRPSREQASRAAREHNAQARVSKAQRSEARQSAPKGAARPAAKARGRAVSGLGQALHTNEITCRGCKSIQHLPAGWQDELEDTSWYCSFCGRLILSR
ncbi:MAG: J domain-containing protein [Acidimicrobiales bacterium]